MIETALTYQIDTTTLKPITQKSFGAAAQVADGGFAGKQTTVGLITYSAEAVAGSAESSAVWRVSRIDRTTGVRTTWADGNTNPDNVATDLTILNYF